MSNSTLNLLAVDILPTILDTVGLRVPAQMQGRPLRGVAGGDNTDWRKETADPFLNLDLLKHD